MMLRIIQKTLVFAAISLFSGAIFAQSSGGGTGLNAVTGQTPIVVTTSGNTALVACPTCGTGGGSIPSTTNLIKGNGSGDGADSGIAPANVPLLNGANVFDNASGNAFLSSGAAAFTSQTSSTFGNEFGINVTSAGGHDWTLVNSGSALPPAGEFSFNDSTTNHVPFGLISNSDGTGVVKFGSTTVAGWVSAVDTIGTNLDTGFSRDSAGVVDLGNGTAASKSGSLNLTNLTVSGTCTGCGSGSGLSANDLNIYTQPQEFQLGPRVGATAYDATGDSITACVGVASDTNCYVNKIAVKIGVTAINYGISGAQSEDWVIGQIFPYLNPIPTNNPVVTANILSNDNHFCGSTTGCIANATSSVMAGLSYATIPITNKVFGNAPTSTTGTWTADTTVIPYGVTSSTNGSTQTYTFTTTKANEPVYVWYEGQDSNAGTGSISIDSGAITDTVSTASTSGQCICTVNSGTKTVWGKREVIPTAGTHTLLLTVTSSSGSILWFGLGTPSNVVPASIGPPSIFFGSSIYEEGMNLSAGTNLYYAAMSTLTTQMQGDGLLIGFGNINSWINNTYAMTCTNLTVPNGLGDNNSGTTVTAVTSGNCGQHPDIVGHGYMADYYLSMIQPAGAASSGGGGTVNPGAQYAAATYPDSGTNSVVGPVSGISFPPASAGVGVIAISAYDIYGEGFLFNPGSIETVYPIVDGSNANAVGFRIDHSGGVPYDLGFFGSGGGNLILNVSSSAPNNSQVIGSTGATTFNYPITATTTTTGQLIGNGSTPTIAVGAAAGTGATASISGTNIAGVITLNTGTVTTGAGVLATITFNGTLSTAPKNCTIQSLNSSAAGNSGMDYTSAPSTTTWLLNEAIAPAAVSSTFLFGYQCI